MRGQEASADLPVKKLLDVGLGLLGVAESLAVVSEGLGELGFCRSFEAWRWTDGRAFPLSFSVFMSFNC